MKRNFFYAIVIALCGAIGFASCTKDYDDDLRIQRELIEQNNQELLAMIKAYQVLVENTIEQMDIAYKNADNLIIIRRDCLVRQPHRLSVRRFYPRRQPSSSGAR